jgi:hypothetical protein
MNENQWLLPVVQVTFAGKVPECVKADKRVSSRRSASGRLFDMMKFGSVPKAESNPSEIESEEMFVSLIVLDLFKII